MKITTGFNKDKYLSFFLTLLAGLLGGNLFSLLDLPLPWILGPMFLTVFLTMTIKDAYSPPSCTLVGFFILGISMGLYFVPEMGAIILDQLEFVIVMTFVLFFLSVMNGVLYKNIFKLDWMTAIFGSIPGGTAQMIEIGKELGGKPEIIAIQQFIRLVFVVMIIPSFLIFSSKPADTIIAKQTEAVNVNLIGLLILFGLGCLGVVIGRFLSIPLYFLTGPLIVVAIFSLSGVSLGDVPPILLHIAQLFIGINIGNNFKKKELLEYRKYLMLGLLAGISLTAMSFFAAFLLYLWSGIDFATAILCMAPGGVAEMSLTAVIIGANVPLVAAFQVFRMLVFLTIVPKAVVFIINRIRLKSNALEH
ncbi:AbrB family transcriptional regulator [Neobacillus niacini]|uniref:AbrB family transcriptional regulator n=1 Tax=Neobacillus niacini TaxID=86668 RepID=UPI0007AB60E0|nr:AbrB family transcriptional regulator [Neobacillus niacini]MEC1525015.1 AbrB family transcriptional regulator [Neobacillus niacini]